MKDVMIDLETLGTGKNACIVQVGAARFDRKTGEIQETMCVSVDPRTAVAAGAQIDADTVCWWLAQSKEAQNSVFNQPTLPITAAMQALNEFIGANANVWCHVTFDFPIVSETLKALAIKPKFRYSSGRDIRTLTELAGMSRDEVNAFPRTGIHHDALADCLHQIKYCVVALNRLAGK